MAAAVALAGCSAKAAAHPPAPTTAVLKSDTWSAPAVEGPPSASSFCTLLTSVYRHEAQLPAARDPKVKERIIRDYIDTVPEILAQAPPAVAPAAQVYLAAVSRILNDLEQSGLNYKKITDPQFAAVLLDPKVKAAGNQVLYYSRTQCHYTIGGA